MLNERIRELRTTKKINQVEMAVIGRIIISNPIEHIQLIIDDIRNRNTSNKN